MNTKTHHFEDIKFETVNHKDIYQQNFLESSQDYMELLIDNTIDMIVISGENKNFTYLISETIYIQRYLLKLLIKVINDYYDINDRHKTLLLKKARLAVLAFISYLDKCSYFLVDTENFYSHTESYLNSINDKTHHSLALSFEENKPIHVIEYSNVVNFLEDMYYEIRPSTITKKFTD